MYEIFLVITFIVIILIKELKMAQAINFLALTLIYFLNEMNMLIETNQYKFVSVLSILITCIIIIINIQNDKLE